MNEDKTTGRDEMGSNGQTKAQNRAYAKTRHVNHPWIRPYYKARDRCLYVPRYQGYEFSITREDVKGFWDRDNAESMDRPSIDRRDNKRGYTPDNCRFIELNENQASGRRKPVFVLDEDGVVLGWFRSARDAANMCKCKERSIGNCCREERTYHMGHRWKFAPNIDYTKEKGNG